MEESEAPGPEQPEYILIDMSVSNNALVNNSVMHQALGNNSDHFSTTVLAIRGHRAFLSMTE